MYTGASEKHLEHTQKVLDYVFPLLSYYPDICLFGWGSVPIDPNNWSSTVQTNAIEVEKFEFICKNTKCQKATKVF